MQKAGILVIWAVESDSVISVLWFGVGNKAESKFSRIVVGNGMLPVSFFAADELKYLKNMSFPSKLETLLPLHHLYLILPNPPKLQRRFPALRLLRGGRLGISEEESGWDKVEF